MGYHVAKSLSRSSTEETIILGDTEDLDEHVPLRYSITSYGADYPIDSLVSRLNSDAIYVPKFQRGFVWNMKRASRFIESLLLGLPVPGIFLARESETQRLIVIDGQQRLKSIQFFYEGFFPGASPDKWREFRLDLNTPGISNNFHASSYKSLSDEDRRHLDDSIIHATIIKQDEPSDGQSSVYSIFERLNTGGMSLSPQEIRASIFHGQFSNLLEVLNKNTYWRALFGPIIWTDERSGTDPPVLCAICRPRWLYSSNGGLSQFIYGPQSQSGTISGG